MFEVDIYIYSNSCDKINHKQWKYNNDTRLNFYIQSFLIDSKFSSNLFSWVWVYVFTKTFEKCDRRVGVKIYIHEVSVIESRNIDYLQNFEIADAI